MAKYIGPKSKIARRFGEAIYGADKVLEKRNFPPGQHGLMRKRKKVSEYGEQLSEKQKAKYTYGSLTLVSKSARPPTVLIEAEGEVHLRAAGEAVRPYLRGCVPHGRHHG